MRLFVIWLLLGFLLVPVSSTADDVYIVILKKQEQKKQRGWSLADWMNTKRTIDMQNQWLALNSSANTFEFYLDLASSKYALESGDLSQKDLSSLGGRLGFFVTIFGVEYEYQKKSDEELINNSILLSLRLFGTSDQSTNLSIGYGYQSSKVDDIDGENNFWQTKLNLNLLPFLGLEGSYRQFLDKEIDGKLFNGTIYKYGAHVDISFIRLYGNYFKEDSKFSDVNFVKDGFEFGVKAYF